MTGIYETVKAVDQLPTGIEIGYMEDEHLVREETATGLRDRGASVLILDSLSEAEQFVDSCTGTPILLLDIDQGPGKAFYGLRVSRIVKKRNPKAVVILLSAHMSAITDDKLAVANADGYILKSAIPEDVRNVFEACADALGVSATAESRGANTTLEVESPVTVPAAGRVSFARIAEGRRAGLIRSLRPYRPDGITLGEVCRDHGVEIVQQVIDDQRVLADIIDDEFFDYEDLATVSVSKAIHIRSPVTSMATAAAERYFEELRGAKVAVPLLEREIVRSPTVISGVSVYTVSGCVRSFGEVDSVDSDSVTIKAGYLDLLDPESQDDRLDTQTGMVDFKVDCYIVIVNQ